MSASLRIRNFRTGYAPVLTCTANYSLRSMEEYAAYYWRHDKWANRASQLGMSRVFASKDLIADEEMERSEWYQDWARKLDFFYVIGTVFPVGEDEVCSFGIHRQRSRGTYQEHDKRPVAEFLPHLRRALQLRQRLARPAIERHAALDALERTGIATLVVGREGEVIYANSQAEELLRAGDSVRVFGGRLAAAGRSNSEKLSLLIHEAVCTASDQRGNAPGGSVAIQRGERLPLTILVAPFRPAQNGLGWSAPAAILFIRDPEQVSLASATIQDLFGLTSAEASVASALATGKSIEKIAASSAVSRNTVRTHLKNVLAKTGTSRQAELVALLHRTTAPLTAK
jgi:DNA-binding CsgD family transcriptional regulator